VGDVNLKTDGQFILDRKLHVIDLKSSFNSKEKGNLQRLRAIGAVYKLWRPKTRLLVLVREPHENEPYLEHLSDVWEVRCGNAAYTAIQELTDVDLKGWIEKHVDFSRHLRPELWRHLERENLPKYFVY